MKEFILQEVQGCINRVILLASLTKKMGYRPTPPMLIFKKNSQSYAEGNHHFSMTTYIPDWLVCRNLQYSKYN